MNRSTNKSHQRSLYLRMMSLVLINKTKNRLIGAEGCKRQHSKISRFLSFAFMMLLFSASLSYPQEKDFTNTFQLGLNGFSSLGSNPYFTLNPGYQLTLEGDDDGEFVVVIITVLDETETVDGVETRVVQEYETIDGELVEISRNFFALDNRTNSLVYFGEDVDIYEDGVIASHDGAWKAGVDGALPGILLPGLPLLGARHYQETAPDTALDRAEIIGINGSVMTGVGTYNNCLIVEETTPIEPDALDYKYYAPGIGLVQSNSLFVTEIVGEPFFHINDYQQITDYTEHFMIETCVFSSTGRNPYFILEPGYQLIYEGEEDGEPVGLTITVLPETKNVGGIETRIIEEYHTVDGEVEEISRNYFAICQRTNSVFYFGEEVDIFEKGNIVSHDGAWLAGENGATAGVFIPGDQLLGAKHFQEIAVDVAMDRAEIAGLDETVETPYGIFENSLMTRETSPLEPDVEDFKFYAPNVGLLKDNALELTQISTPSSVHFWEVYE